MVEVIFFIAFFLIILIGCRGLLIADKLREHSGIKSSSMAILFVFNNEAFSKRDKSVLELKDSIAENYYRKGVINSRSMFIIVLALVLLIFIFE